MGDEPPDMIEKSEMNQPLNREEVSMTFPEFEDYSFDQDDEKPKGLLDKAVDIFDNAYYTTLHYKERAKLQLKQSGIIDKIKQGTKISYDNIKKFGEGIYSKSKPIVNQVKTKAVDGFNNLKNKTINVFKYFD